TTYRSLQLKSARDFCHLRVRKRFSLLDCLLYRAQHNFLEKCDIVWIDNFPVDLDCDHVASAVRRHSYFAATRTHFDSLRLELSLCFRHLLLHLLRSEERRVGKECRSVWWSYG